MVLSERKPQRLELVDTGRVPPYEFGHSWKASPPMSFTIVSMGPALPPLMVRA